MNTEVNKLILVESFKTKRGDGSSSRTLFFINKGGVIHIERFILGKTLNEGFIPIRTFGDLIYQKERMVFKYGSFNHIARRVLQVTRELKQEDIFMVDETESEYKKRVSNESI